MAEAVETSVGTETGAAVGSPPAAPSPVRAGDDGPRARLHQLADVLARGMNRRLLVEYLRLRRACR